MKVRNDYMLVCETMKRLMKSQKVSYRELAQRIGMSESGFKKVIGADDGSFQRLSQVAEALGTSLSAILSAEEDAKFENVEFTAGQQEFLSKNLEFFYYYWKLVYERLPVDRIERDYGITPRESFTYLRKLDELGLIQLGALGKVKIPALNRIHWVGGGPLVEKIYQAWGQQTVRDLARPNLGPSELFIIRYFKMQAATFRDFLSTVRKLEEEFTRLAIREMELNLPDLTSVRWVTAIDDKSFLNRIK